MRYEIKRPSEAIRGHPEAIQRPSRDNHKRPSRGHPEAIQRPSRGHPEAIQRPQNTYIRDHERVCPNLRWRGALVHAKGRIALPISGRMHRLMRETIRWP